MTFPEKYLDLFSEEHKVFLFLATVNAKGIPQVTPVWNDPYRYLGMRGRVVSHTTDGADEHINKLSLRYDGKPWKYREGQKRIIYKIQPTSFDEH